MNLRHSVHPNGGRLSGLLPILVLAACSVAAEDTPPAAAPTDVHRPPLSTDTRLGLLSKTDAACPGYTLVAPLNSTTTYLVDLEGRLVHSWPSRYTPGQSAYLLPDGSLLRAAREPRNRHFGGGGIGGRVERLAPDGKVLWEYVLADERRCQHHDIEPLPNGNVLLIAWEKKTREEALDAGFDPDRVTAAGLWPDCIIEVEPQGSSGGKIVWEWHVWDHLIQDFDPSKSNYGVVADHPELVDANYRRTAPRETPEEIERLRALGYIDGDDGGDEPDDDPANSSPDRQQRPPRQGPGWGPPFGGPGGFGGSGTDWCHTNAVAYNAKLDQIALSIHTLNEIWIIDHSTTSEEAASHAGGRSGKGGDLLYRWGNPRAYGAGDQRDQKLFAQHDVRWIPEGFPGGGNLMIFNNGMGRPGQTYSSVIEIVTPVTNDGRYGYERGKPFEPAGPKWEYTAKNKSDFFSGHISGAERLPNGNTLICAGEQARIFEVDVQGRTVWDFISPFDEQRRPDEGFEPPGGGSNDRERGPGFSGRERNAGWDGPPGGGSGDGRRRERGRRPFGPPGGGPGGFPGGGLFRASRICAECPGIKILLDARSEK